MTVRDMTVRDMTVRDMTSSAIALWFAAASLGAESRSALVVDLRGPR